MTITISGSGTISGITSAVGVISPGTIAFFGATTAPDGYLKANGAQVSRTAYAALFDAIGTTFGIGDGITTFNLPDLRGEFLRAWDDSRGTDPGRALGTAQGQDWKSLYVTNTVQNGSTGFSHTDVYWGKSMSSYIGNIFTGYWNSPASACGAKWDTSEIRPRNISVLACIKY